MLYKRPNSSYWWVRLTDPTGRDLRRSTGTADRAAAEEYAARLTTDLWRQARMGDQPRRTWEDAVVRWVGETAHKASKEDDLSLLRWIDPHLHGMDLESIGRDALDAMAAARREGGASNATCNRTLAVVRAILRRAERDWGWIAKAPAVRMLKEPTGRIRWLTREEAERLIGELPEHLADMARLTLATGLREANITGLRWDQIDLQRRVAWVHPDESKTRRAIGVPLNADAMLVLRKWQGRHPERVFIYRGEPITKAGGGAWRKAMARAGIEHFRWHDLRHTWASWHVQAGTPLQALQELGGWTSFAMVLRYSHLAPEHLAAHADRIATPIAVVA
jgi:integrase